MATERRREGWRKRWSRDGEEVFGVQKHLSCPFSTHAAGVLPSSKQNETDEVLELLVNTPSSSPTSSPPSLLRLLERRTNKQEHRR